MEIYHSTLVLLLGFLLALKLTFFPSDVLNFTGLLVFVFFFLAKKDGIDKSPQYYIPLLMDKCCDFVFWGF